MEIEIWKSIVGYEGIYEASSLGAIRSMDRVRDHGAKNLKRILKGRRIRAWTNCKGYRIVALSRNGEVKNKAVHKLVCTAFHLNPLGKKCANHKDGVKLNNRQDNLEHATYSENNQHAFDTGLKPPTILHGAEIGTAKLTDAIVLEIRALARGLFNQRAIARRFNVHECTIDRVVSRKTWRHI